MKNLISILLFAILICIPAKSFAVSLSYVDLYGTNQYNNLGSNSESIKVEIDPYQLQKIQNQTKEATVINVCGNNYSICRGQYLSYYAGSDTSNPYQVSTYLSLIQSCCETKKSDKLFADQIIQRINQQNEPKTPILSPAHHSPIFFQPNLGSAASQCATANGKFDSNGNCFCDGQWDSANGKCIAATQISDQICEQGFFLFYGQCLSLDVQCQSKYGIGSKNTKYDISTKKNTCDCLNGYEWNNDKSACVEIPKKPTETPDQTCWKNYGFASNFTGTYNDKGDYVCDCKGVKGYKWNDAGNKCVVDSNINNPISNKVPIKIKTPAVVLPAQKNSKVIKTSTEATGKSPFIKSTTEVSTSDEKKSTNTTNNNSETVKQQPEMVGNLIIKTVKSWFVFLFRWR